MWHPRTNSANELKISLQILNVTYFVMNKSKFLRTFYAHISNAYLDNQDRTKDWWTLEIPDGR